MSLYQLEYKASNAYASQVWGAYLKFLIHPYSAIGAQIHKPYFSSNVQGEWWISNARQKEVSDIFFKSNTKFDSLEIKYSVLVDVPINNPFEKISLPIEHEKRILDSNSWIIDNYRFIQSNPQRPKSYVSASDCSAFYWLNEGHLLDKIIRLRDQVYHYIEFASGHTNTSTCATEIVLLKKGVCQDFTHLFLGLLRHFGVASRYTSGYLHQGTETRGASQLHAWAECHIPEIGWMGIDPTNNLLVDHHYIKICHGYDYDDCLPVSGVLNSMGNQQSTEHQVIVQQIQ